MPGQIGEQTERLPMSAMCEQAVRAISKGLCGCSCADNQLLSLRVRGQTGCIATGAELFFCTCACTDARRARRAAQDEFARGDQVCTEALAPGGAGPAAWARLLEPVAFFAQFKNYLQVLLSLAQRQSGAASGQERSAGSSKALARVLLRARETVSWHGAARRRQGTQAFNVGEVERGRRVGRADRGVGAERGGLSPVGRLGALAPPAAGHARGAVRARAALAKGAPRRIPARGLALQPGAGDCTGSPLLERPSQAVPVPAARVGRLAIILDGCHTGRAPAARGRGRALALPVLHGLAPAPGARGARPAQGARQPQHARGRVPQPGARARVLLLAAGWLCLASCRVEYPTSVCIP